MNPLPRVQTHSDILQSFASTQDIRFPASDRYHDCLQQPTTIRTNRVNQTMIFSYVPSQPPGLTISSLKFGSKAEDVFYNLARLSRTEHSNRDIWPLCSA